MKDEVIGLVDLQASEVHPRPNVFIEQSKVGKYKCSITISGSALYNPLLQGSTSNLNGFN